MYKQEQRTRMVTSFLFQRTNVHYFVILGFSFYVSQR